MEVADSEASAKWVSSTMVVDLACAVTCFVRMARSESDRFRQLLQFFFNEAQLEFCKAV